MLKTETETESGIQTETARDHGLRGFFLAGKAWKPHAAIINSIILAQTAPKTAKPEPGPQPEGNSSKDINDLLLFQVLGGVEGTVEWKLELSLSVLLK